MVFRGHVTDGVVVLDEETSLPNGTHVEVIVRTLPEDAGDENASFTERFAAVLGKVEGLPEDAAEHHDHYLYGVPKQ